MAAAASPAGSGLSRSIEDYLKAVYELGGETSAVQTNSIADALDVAPASVSGMLRRLSEAGLLEHVPYRGVLLTEDGRRAAVRMVRRHRILESYLVTMLGYDWDSVHAEAELLEHAVSDRLIERMAQALDYPAYDPHGAPIPTSAGQVEELHAVPLADIPVGADAELRLVSDKDPERLRYLSSLGLEVGTRFAVVARQPFDGPVTIHVPEREPLVLGHELARALGCVIRREEP
ncbi:MAG TPA: metal-dependent transcriptional regulator [Gemmatimonadales bacterium]|nr:metal-dependent transcriptional regulator [Gemmatimonadales bacterium]